MTSEDETDPHPTHGGELCGKCGRAIARKIIAAIRNADLKIGNVHELNAEQLMQVFCAGAVALSEEYPGDETEKAARLFKTFARAHLDAPLPDGPPP